jgi:hypothetical protein
MGSDDGVQHSREPVIEVSSLSGTQLTRGSFPPDVRTETDPVSETLFSLIFLEYWMMDKSKNLVILIYLVVNIYYAK